MKRLGAVVLGMSPDSAESHAKFAGKFDLNFPLLSDPGAAVAKKYQVWKEKSLYGRKFMGIERSTFLIGKDGKVKRIWRKVKVAAHDDEVVEALKELRAAG
jgi:peroxiredoxin Q/BCP